MTTSAEHRPPHGGYIARREDYATHAEWLAAVAPGTGLRPEYAMWADRELFGRMERELQQLRGAVDAARAVIESAEPCAVGQRHVRTELLDALAYAIDPPGGSSG